MRLLIDTHVLIWAVAQPSRLTAQVASIVADKTNIILFSSVSIWEVAIKHALGRPDFSVHPEQLIQEALKADFEESRLTAAAAARVAALPLHHRDPFDRLLVAQAIAEDARLLSADAALAAYGPSVLTLAAAAARDLAP